MGYFAVIDTETNWEDRVMSIGTVIADTDTFRPIAAKYHILPEECAIGGMFYDALFLDTPVKPIACTREEAMEDLSGWLCRYGVSSLFAYNAGFDRNHLPELWYFDCYGTGRVKRGYGVESMLRMLSGNCTYRETHNALFDALDELEIVRLLGHGIHEYILL